MKTTKCGPDESSPAVAIREAKRLVSIVTEAEDVVLGKALVAISKGFVIAGTCGHPKKVLSAENTRRNMVLQSVYDEVSGMLSDPLPF